MRVTRGEFDDEVREWLQRGFQAHERAEGDLTLDRCLELPRGKRANLVKRDECLREAFSLCDGKSATARARHLALEIMRFGPLRRQVEAGNLPEASLSRLRQAVLGAYRQDAPMPSSWRQLLRICALTQLAVEMSTAPADSEQADGDLDPRQTKEMSR